MTALRDTAEWEGHLDFPKAMPTSCPAAYAYAVQFDTGVVKIGHTTTPRIRINTHAKVARRLRVHLVDGWISEPHFDSIETERAGLLWAEHNATRIGGEYFADLDLDALVSFLTGFPLPVCESHLRWPHTAPVLAAA